MSKYYIFLTLMTLLLLIVGCDTTSIVSMRALNENPDLYLNKTVTVKGQAYNLNEQYQSLKDYDGYNIRFKNSAGNDLYFYNYAITGRFLKGQESKEIYTPSLDKFITSNSAVYYIDATIIKRIESLN